MPLARIEKRLWQRYFDHFSAALGAKQVEIEIVGPRIGYQPQAKRVALTGLSYDGKGDVFAVIGEALEHNIRPPRPSRAAPGAAPCRAATWAATP